MLLIIPSTNMSITASFPCFYHSIVNLMSLKMLTILYLFSMRACDNDDGVIGISDVGF